MIVALSSGDKKPRVEDGVALVLQPKGYIVEQLTYVDPVQKAIDDMTDNGEPPEELLYDLIDAIKNAKDDKRITTLVISTRYMMGAGVTKLQDLADAIADFKKSGKQVIAFDDNYSQAQYYLASTADKIYMSPNGGVLLTGFARVGTYFKGLLERFGVNVHVFKVGKYKSAVEPFIRNNMSPEAKEANKQWLSDLWQEFVADITARRGLTSDDINQFIDQLKERVTAYNGDFAKMALDADLVDELTTRIAFREKMIELVGKDKKHHSFKQIHHKDYLRAIRSPLAGKVIGDGARIALITAKGNIVDGNQKEGVIGGDTVSRLIRKARNNDNTKAIVLRVDSGGGSAFASEIIREELEKAQQQGIKVVVSMGDVAASGGYWISATADEIWARNATITGSIGIFGMIPTFEKVLNEYGIFRDGVGTTRYANFIDVGQPLSEDVAQIIQTEIEMGYDKFLELVARGRNMSKEQVHEIAQGRVWSGKKALELGLVDKIGSLEDALKSAAEMAGLEEGKYKIWRVKRELSEQEKLLQELFGNADAKQLLTTNRNSGRSKLMNQISGQVSEITNQLSRWTDPKHAYADCLCEIKL